MTISGKFYYDGHPFEDFIMIVTNLCVFIILINTHSAGMCQFEASVEQWPEIKTSSKFTRFRTENVIQGKSTVILNPFKENLIVQAFQKCT